MRQVNRLEKILFRERLIKTRRLKHNSTNGSPDSMLFGKIRFCPIAGFSKILLSHLVTMSHEKHYSTDKHGREQVSIQNYQLSFLVKNDAEQNQTGVWSDQYESLAKKVLRQAFARELFQRMRLQFNLPC